MKFRNINFLKHFMINDQYKLDIVDQLVNCKTIKCNYVHYFMMIRIMEIDSYFPLHIHNKFIYKLTQTY
jgi:hypothetical protein